MYHGTTDKPVAVVAAAAVAEMYHDLAGPTYVMNHPSSKTTIRYRVDMSSEQASRLLEPAPQIPKRIVVLLRRRPSSSRVARRRSAPHIAR